MNVPTTAPGVSADPLVSVIIGFKDRGLGRLEMSIRSIHDSLAEIDHEIIISDYGSADTAAIASLAERVSAHHEVVKTDGEWSAARARNAAQEVLSFSQPMPTCYLRRNHFGASWSS